MAKKQPSLAELVRSEYGTREPKYSIKKAVPNTPVKGKRDFSVRVSDGPSASEIGKSVLGVVKNAPAGVVPTAQMLGQGLLDLGKFSAKNAYLGLKDRFTGGDEQMQNFAATDFAKSLAANPGRVVAENAPVIGGALSVSDLMSNAIAARRSGDEATASRLEGLVVPMLAAGLVPGGKAVASTERGLLRGAGKLAAVERAWTEKGIKHAITERDGTITLSKIVVPKDERGSGKGTAAMKQLLTYADNTGQRVVLTPSSDFGGNKKRLTGFYKKLGFAENKGKKRDFSVRETMVREPDASSPEKTKPLRIKTEDEGDWELPADFGEDVPIVTTGPAIIQRPKPVETWHGTPNVFAAERKVVTPEGAEQFVVGKPDVLPDVPADFKVLKDYPLGRFRSEKLGSGEGAQQYGIGTYLAENIDTGRNYRSELTQDTAGPMIGGSPLEEVYSRLQRRADTIDFANSEALYDRLAALEDLGLNGDVRSVLDRAAEGAYRPDTTEWFKREIVPKYRAPGALYQVQMNIDPRSMLDYDAPLSSQSEAIRRAVSNMDLSDIAGGRRSHVKLGWFLANQEKPHDLATGRDLLAALPHSRDYEHTIAGSQYLLGQGIPGIRYWDEGSREMGKGTRNYVVFDPERDLEIKDRYACGGLAVKR